MSMAPQGRNNNDFAVPAPQKIESGSVMQPQRSRSSHGPQMSALRSTNVKNTHVAVPFATRSGSVEMSQKNFMNRNATMSNMEQMKNMYKHSIHASQVNVNKPAQASKAESIAVDTEPVFQISGQQEEIKRVGGENYVDRSVDITPENIMASI